MLKKQKELMKKGYSQKEVKFIVKKSFFLFYQNALEEDLNKRVAALREEMSSKLLSFQKNFDRGYFSVFSEKEEERSLLSNSSFQPDLSLHPLKQSIESLQTQSCTRKNDRVFNFNSFKCKNFDPKEIHHLPN